MGSSAHTELLAPAGEPEAGYAALHYGADAVYLGLERFSARAEAVNFTPRTLAEFAGFAHALSPRRNVYLTLNTVVKERELAVAADTLLAAAEAGIDAVIVQDLGVAGLVKRWFPALALHASTQMAIHNLAGALAARELGFTRVTLARELTLDEIENIAARSGMEIEVFVHGALCYSYSGLCLYSSLTTGRSGNRGRCAYPCREAVTGDAPVAGTHPFSLKDLALGPKVLDLARAGVASLKIEGRKKSPLYVAATVDYYRRLLDGRLAPGETGDAEAVLQTIFARPWTRFFHDGAFNPAVADLEIVGHQGAPLGSVEDVRTTREGREIVFTTGLDIEVHDGIQTVFPGDAKAQGFAVDVLRRHEGKGWPKVFAAPPGSRVAVMLPADFPAPARGQTLYLASSQAVKRSFPYDKPKEGRYKPRLPLDLSVSFSAKDSPGDSDRAANGPGEARVSAAGGTMLPSAFGTLAGEGGLRLAADIAADCPAYPAEDPAGAEMAARGAFERLGESEYAPGSWTFANPDRLFVKPGALNAVRRDLVGVLDRGVDARKAELRAELATSVDGAMEPSTPESATAWSLCVDRIDALMEMTGAELSAVDEIGLLLENMEYAEYTAHLEKLLSRVPREKIRLAPPLIVRGKQEDRLRERMERLTADGWTRWLLSNLTPWRWLHTERAVDCAADWPLYVLNHGAGETLRDMGFTAVTLSPEDGGDNYRELAGRLNARAIPFWVMCYGKLPYFISAACVHAALGLCKSGGKTDDTIVCGKTPLALQGASGVLSEVVPLGCGSMVVGDSPYSLVPFLPELSSMGVRRYRVDLRWSRASREGVKRAWERIRSGEMAGGFSANFQRGLI